jgi:hypothetical protein
VKNEKYAFLEWVFDDVGFGKFLLLLYLFVLLIGLGVVYFIWWYTEPYR